MQRILFWIFNTFVTRTLNFVHCLDLTSLLKYTLGHPPLMVKVPMYLLNFPFAYIILLTLYLQHSTIDRQMLSRYSSVHNKLQGYTFRSGRNWKVVDYARTESFSNLRDEIKIRKYLMLGDILSPQFLACLINLALYLVILTFISDTWE